jgi:N-methylhydantoinase A/oxoprolinase/acetone carboxylase beta subunit
MRVGVDVGGTNTDAVLMSGSEVVAWHKTPTTEDVTTGIANALEGILGSQTGQAASVDAVMIGTTHFTNAVVERRRLLEVAVIRLGLPATAALPPMVDWPEDLRAAMGGHVYMLEGGHEFDGREIAALNEAAAKDVAQQIRELGLRSVAITSVFSPVNSEMEMRCAEILQQTLPDIHVNLSNEIGRVGLLPRENAVIMNACLRELAVSVVGAFQSALARFGLDVPLYISQNDGTLMSASFAEQYPVLTFASGPTNSMRGAGFLSGVSEGIVVDIGGTTSDVGALSRGFPRESSTAVEVAEVGTNFRMPDVLSFGLGGGSYVQSNGTVSVGPRSVGFRLTEMSRVFGGDVLTATDIAVAAGYAEIGDPTAVSTLDAALVESAVERMHVMIESAVDRMKTSAIGVPVVLVGGGAVLVGHDLEGASEIIRPEHAAVANAIGAAIAQVGGEVDRIYSLAASSRDDVLAEAKAEAMAKAIEAGAREDTLEVVDVEEVPLAYLPSNAVRVRVKAVGALALD